VVGLKEHTVDILDIGGMDVYKNMYNTWFRSRDAFVYVFSLADEDSFVRLGGFRDEIQQIKKSTGILLSRVPMILVGTHLDEEREVSEEMGQRMADALGCPYFETSSKFTHYWRRVAIKQFCNFSEGSNDQNNRGNGEKE